MDKLEPVKTEHQKKKDEEWAFLVTVEDDREIDVIESLLRSYGIPLLRKYKWAGGFLKIVMGLSSYGVDLYVPKSRLETAREILDCDPEDIIPE